LFLLAAGCLDSKTVVKVSRDGSGTIEHTIYMKPQANAKEKPIEEQRAGCAKTATALGEGVTFKSIEALEPREGWKGTRMVYAFQDVTKLRITHLPPMGGKPPDAAEQYRFEFRGGDAPQLTVARPAVKVEKEESSAEQDASTAKDFEGCRVEFQVVVEGTVTKTTATYANEAKTGAVLFRYDLGALYKDKAALAAVRSLCKLTDAKDVAAKLKDAAIVKYLQVEPEERVTIEFK
jgi:hypothetical protein